ncbi:MAG: ribosome biogenesis GTPase Der [Bacteroidales bacterium]|nr:ribosome biogenesis GTPase Der [Bacteroidales bacterium]
MSGIIAIVGRPNVGKSTLFNRLVEEKQAIIDAKSGVTRDRNYGEGVWNGREFTVIDTGGVTIKSDDAFEDAICKQVVMAMNEADVIIFMVDVKTGITDLDSNVADMLRRANKPFFLVVNKVDDGKYLYDATEFYSLGLGDYFTISSANGSGTGDLLDAVIAKLPPEKPKDDSKNVEEIPHVAVVGRPNVGKSSFINALIGEEQHIVTPVAGTTRDSIGTRFNKFGYDYYFIDTAGLRKKEKVNEDLEFYSVLRSIRSLESADVCVLMIDANDGIESQDMNILHLIIKNNKGVVICVNKWDLIEKTTNTARDFEENLRKKIAPFSDVPIIFTSVLEKQRIQKILEKIHEVYENRKRRVQTARLNEIMLEAIDRFSPPAIKGKNIKIKYVTQLPTPYPAFAFFASNAKYVKDSYKRYLENQLRKNFNFNGTTVRIYVRDK